MRARVYVLSMTYMTVILEDKVLTKKSMPRIKDDLHDSLRQSVSASKLLACEEW